MTLNFGSSKGHGEKTFHYSSAPQHLAVCADADESSEKLAMLMKRPVTRDRPRWKKKVMVADWLVRDDGEFDWLQARLRVPPTRSHCFCCNDEPHVDMSELLPGRTVVTNLSDSHSNMLEITIQRDVNG